MRFFIGIVLCILVASVQADWWDNFADTISGGLVKAASWVKEDAAPVVREKFEEAKDKLKDPETHRAYMEWLKEKAAAAKEFAETEILPEAKKIFDAAKEGASKLNEETSTPSKDD